jgi:hypothetical protein
MAVLFQTTQQNVSLHLQDIFKEGELQPEATVKEFLTVAVNRSWWAVFMKGTGEGRLLAPCARQREVPIGVGMRD